MSFSTVEDINGAMFDNQGFWWYTADTALIDPNVDAEFSNVKFDFLTISKEKVDTYDYKFTVKVDNSLWTGGAYIFNQREMPNVPQIQFTDDGFTVILRRGVYDFPAKIVLYMGITELHSVKERMRYYLDRYSVMDLPLNDLANKRVLVRMWGDIFVYGVTLSLTKGFNEVRYNNTFAGFILVNILKTDFQFQCSQSLTVGEVNTVRLGASADYKPNGDLIGEYTPEINIQYGQQIIPAVWNNSVNDYTFNLDLTNVTSAGKIRFKVIVNDNDVLNHTETDVVLNADYEVINTLSKLQNLFKIGGIRRLTGNITLTNDLTTTQSVSLIGNNGSINLNGHKIIVASDLTFKADNISFSNGFNSIQQQTGSSVELTDCIFTNCSGFGSIIDCQIDINSLNDEDDFHTILTRCNISNSDMMILHGGHLEINECIITGKVGNKNYPYCLYQADGNASITRTEFSLVDGTVYDYDLLFNPCIFTVGETATINGLGHKDLQRNNVTALLGDVRNTSVIDLTYHYNLIEDTINLKSTNGFCHNVSGEDFVFKTNIELTRG